MAGVIARSKEGKLVIAKLSAFGCEQRAVKARLVEKGNYGTNRFNRRYIYNDS